MTITGTSARPAFTARRVSSCPGLNSVDRGTVKTPTIGLPGADAAISCKRFSFARIAMECGYPNVYEFTDIDSWCTQMSNILFEDGPVMVVFKSLPLMPDWSKSRRREIKSSAWLAHNSID